MHQTRFLDALRTLSPRERLRWRQYLQSDFHNKHKRLRQLGEYVLQHLPEAGFLDKAATDHPLHKQRVFATLFGPDAPYHELKLNNLVSDLYELLLDFLASLRQEAEPLERQYQIVMALLERSLDKAAAAALEKYRMLLDRRPDRTVEWQYHHARWWEAAELLQARQPRRTAGEHLYRQVEALEAAHHLERLRLAVSLLSRNSLAVLEAGGINRPQWLDDLRNPEPAAPPAAMTWIAALDLLEQPGPGTFKALTAALEAHHALFKKEELTALYQCALNHCIRRINDGDATAYPDALALYRILLERGLLLQQGRLSQWTYKNIATAGLRAGDFAWTEQFLYAYREALPAAERDNAFAFNLASLLFEKNDHAATLQTLQNVEFTDVTYQLGAKILQLKSFYLLGETEALMALLSATQQLLRRNRSLSDFGRRTNLNFLKMLRKISLWRRQAPRLPPDKAAQKKQALREEALRLQPMANKDWLLRVW